MEPAQPWQRADLGRRVLGQRRPRRVQVRHRQRGMRLPRGPERILHAKVQGDAPPFEPDPAAPRQRRGLLNLRQPERPRVEGARRVLPARRHGKLHMMQARDPEFAHILIWQRCRGG